MSVWGNDEETAFAAAPAYVPPPKPKTSAWADVGRFLTAAPRGVTEAAAQVMGTAADLANAARAFRDTPSKDMAARGLPIESFSSDFGDSLRDRGKEFRPDPETASTAEQVLYGFARGATKIVGGAVVGGIPGVMAAGAEEAFTVSDELRRQGVDVDTRGKAGLVQGAGLALAALPAAGTTLKGTLALYAAGGPGGFIAQQALTREILQNAGYDKLGMGYDPLDPVGLAVASLIPAGFAAYGFRQAKIVQAVRDLPDLPKAAPDAPKADTPPAFELSPVAKAAKQYPQEVQDAARVLYQAEVRESANPGAGMDAANKHATALARAEDQMARGEAVQVADVAPAPAVRVTDTPEFRAWFGESKVMDESGAPKVLYHGTGADFSGFDANPRGLFFAENPADADPFSRIRRDGAPNILPVHVAIENPWTMVRYGDDVPYSQMLDQSPEALKAKGYDGTFDPERGVWVAFEPEQVKSAIGNSGRFDPNSPSLTDSPYATWEDQIRAAVEEMRKAAGEPEAPPIRKQMTTAEADFLLSTAKPADATGISESAIAPRLDEIRIQYPDLMVQMDGMAAPMRIDDFLAAAKAEADEMNADATLLQTAAECFLSFGD